MIMYKINVAELLKDCPKGMELDCTAFNNVKFQCADNDGIWIEYIDSDNNNRVIYLTCEGGIKIKNIETKCVIFPKNKTSWEGFVPPYQFKNGDIAISDKGDIHILRTEDSSYCAYRKRWEGLPKFDKTITTSVRVCRLATEEEKQVLFDAIKENGYRWNAETKTLEKLPKFNVGDRIKWIKNGNILEIIKTLSNCYIANYLGSDITILFDREDEYELSSHKFDINTLVPFESKVLVRDSNKKWRPAIYGFCNKFETRCAFYVVGGCVFEQCIPFENNEHLIGKTDDCNEYFKTWR